MLLNSGVQRTSKTICCLHLIAKEEDLFVLFFISVFLPGKAGHW